MVASQAFTAQTVLSQQSTSQRCGTKSQTAASNQLMPASSSRVAKGCLPVVTVAPAPVPTSVAMVTNVATVASLPLPGSKVAETMATSRCMNVPVMVGAPLMLPASKPAEAVLMPAVTAQITTSTSFSSLQAGGSKPSHTAVDSRPVSLGKVLSQAAISQPSHLATNHLTMQELGVRTTAGCTAGLIQPGPKSSAPSRGSTVENNSTDFSQGVSSANFLPTTSAAFPVDLLGIANVVQSTGANPSGVQVSSSTAGLAESHVGGVDLGLFPGNVASHTESVTTASGLQLQNALLSPRTVETLANLSKRLLSSPDSMCMSWSSQSHSVSSQQEKNSDGSRTDIGLNEVPVGVGAGGLHQLNQGGRVPTKTMDHSSTGQPADSAASMELPRGLGANHNPLQQDSCVGGSSDQDFCAVLGGSDGISCTLSNAETARESIIYSANGSSVKPLGSGYGLGIDFDEMFSTCTSGQDAFNL